MITIQAHDTDADVNALSFSADGRLLASSATDGRVKVWAVDRLAGAPPVWEDEPGDGEMHHLQFSPDGRFLFACGEADGGGSAWVWPATGGPAQELDPGPAGALRHASVLACSTDGRFVAWTGGYLGGPSKIVSVSVADRKFHRSFRGHPNAIGILAAGPDGLVSGSADRRVRFWDWQTGRMYHELVLRGYVRTLATSRVGDRLAASCAGTVYLWPLEAPRPRAKRVPTRAVELRGHARAALAVEFSPDGTQLASAAEDGTVRVWDVASGTELRAFAPKLGPLHWVTFAPDGLTLAFSSQKGHIGLLDVDD